jgi:IS5 family transposase
MQNQLSFVIKEYRFKKKQTRREKFLMEMDKLVPWARLVALIEPYYPKGERGRPPIGLERILRMYFLQQWYALADEALEDTIYDSEAMKMFLCIDLNKEGVPDATTLLKFRHLLEKQDLTRQLLDEINEQLAQNKRFLKEGSIVDASIIAAPSSTKNAIMQRDPEMHQTKKGNQWHFGMKVHIGVDAQSGLVHTVVGTAANVSDISQTHKLLHGEEKDVFADAGYTGAEKREEMSERSSELRWHIAMKRGKLRAMAEGKIKEVTRELEKVKAGVRARVEHPFHIIKNLFKHRKTRYRGLAKNTAQLHSLFALANLILAKRNFACAVYP